MGISRMMGSTVQYIIEAVTRIFGPSDDAYPAVGEQPFAGDPYKQTKNEEWYSNPK